MSSAPSRCAARRRSRRRLPALVALTALCVGALAASAPAAVTPPHVLTAFPERDFVAFEEYPANTTLNVTVTRGGVQIASSSGTTDATGFFEVNHPGGSCWTGSTPDLLPGDTVAVTAPGINDTHTIGNVTAQLPAQEGANIVVHGTATAPGGGPLPLGELSSEIRWANGGANRVVAPGDGTLTYDAPGSTAWTARWAIADIPVDIPTVLGGEARGLWLPTANDLTIFENPVAGGPGMPECPPWARTAMTSLTSGAGTGQVDVVNIANAGAPLVVGGVAQADTITGTVTLGGVAKDITVPAGTGAWTVQFSPAEIAALPQGTNTVNVQFAGPGAPVDPQTRTFLKDTIAPAGPSASPPPGTYASPQSVSLNLPAGENGAQIRYTTDGSAPTASSTLYTGSQISVTANQTIRAAVVDAAGNLGAASAFAYVISPATPALVIVTPPPVIGAPSARGPFALGAVTARRSIRARAVRAGRYFLDLVLPPGTRFVQVRAYRLVGRAAQAQRRRLVATQVRRPRRSGAFRMRLDSRRMRRALGRPGTYVLEVRIGPSRTQLGPRFVRRLRVTR